MRPEATHTPTPTPLPDGEDVMARDALWYAIGTGTEPNIAALSAPIPEEDAPPPLVEYEQGTTRTALPYGTVDLLEAASYPHGRLPRPSALGSALVTAFGLQRREADNPFNDHRAYPSVRSRFPVHVFVAEGRRRAVLDVYRHALVDLPDGNRPDLGRQVVLAGRYTRLPPAYRWFRGSLINLELGINLRALAVALELCGLSASTRLPGRAAHGLLADLGLRPSWEWTLPLAVELAPEGDGRPTDHIETDRPVDPVLADVVSMNRAQDFGGPAEPALTAIPETASRQPLSWAELLWRRSAGRMPRGLYGMNGQSRRLAAEALHDAVCWLAVDPPGETLREVARMVTATCVVQNIEGHADGIYEVTDGKAVLRAPGSRTAAELEAEYGYPLAPGNGCDVRHAQMIWFLSVRPRELIAEFGPGSWTAAQYICGWQSQGLSLAAAAHGLYARPARAFQEVPVQRVLGLDGDTMLVTAVIIGTPRFTGPLLDLRL